MRILISAAVILLVLTAGCQKAELMKYEGSDGIYFSFARPDSLPTRDSVQLDFGTRPGVTQDSAVFYVIALGRITANSRPFLMEVDPQRSTAVAGVHYELPPADSLAIPAGAASRRVVVKIKKPAALYDAMVKLYLRLLPNEYFGADMKVVNYTSTMEIKASSIRININDKLEKPPVWDASASYLGTYSRKKLDLMVSVLSLSVARFYGTGTYATTQLNNFSKQLQQYLNAQKAQGNIILEADGTVMKMGPAAQ